MLYHLRRDDNSSAAINSRLNVVVSLTQVWFGSKWLLVFSRVPVTPGTPCKNHFFAVLLSKRPQKAASSLFKTGRLFSLFSCLSLARLLILLLFLMNGNIYIITLGPVYSCSVSAGNVTWREGRCNAVPAPNGSL